jgi:hypothetical protein
MNKSREAMIMVRTCGMAVVIACTIAIAKADEALDFKAAAEKQLNAYADCTALFGKAREKSNDTPEQVADAAAAACADKAYDIRIALEGPPANLSTADSLKVTHQLVDGLRANLIKLIMKSRSSE